MAAAGALAMRRGNSHDISSIQEGFPLEDRFIVTCPYCGEEVEIYLEPDVRGSLVQDCEVCCNPWRVRVLREGDQRGVEVTRADGSE
jgi:hypothetical protein